MTTKKKNQAADQDKLSAGEALRRARDFLADKLPKLAQPALEVSMVGSVAVTLATLALHPDAAALASFISSLAGNWFSAWMMEKRNQLKEWNEADVRQLAQTLEPEIQNRLTDTRLSELAEQLHLATLWLKALNSDAARQQWLQSASHSGLFTAQQLQQAAQNANVSIAGSVIDSVVINTNSVNNVTIQVDGKRDDMRPYVELHKRTLADRLLPLSLQVLDRQTAERKDRFELTEIYTPLYAQPLPQMGLDALVKTRDKQGHAELAEFVDEYRLTERKPLSLIAALNEHPRAMILGGAGSGKSVVLSYLGLILCDRVHPKPQANVDTDKDDDPEAGVAGWTHRSLLPLFVTLRRFARTLRHADSGNDDCNALLEYIRSDGREGVRRGAPELAAHLTQVLLAHGAVFLLDGLDEVPANLQARVRRAVRELVDRYPNCRYAITCRTYSYRDDWQKIVPRSQPTFAELHVLELKPKQVRIFVRNWYAEVARKLDWPNTEARAAELTTDIERRDYLTRLARSPLILTLMALLHSGERRRPLPEDRCALFERAIHVLLDTWQAAKFDDDDGGAGAGAAERPEDYQIERSVWAALDRVGPSKVVEALSRMAATVHAEAKLENRDSTADISQKRLFDVINGLVKDYVVEPDHVVKYLHNRAGLIVDDGESPDPVDRGAHIFRFPHRIFQEFLTAKALSNSPEKVAKLIDIDYARWREVYALIALMNNERQTADCVDDIVDDDPHGEPAWQRVLLAGEIWCDKPVSAELRRDVPRIGNSIDRVRQRLLRLMRGNKTSTLPAPQRAEAGRLLAKLGDVRDYVLTVPPPPLEQAQAMPSDYWCIIPAGPFDMGSNKAQDDFARADETPQFTYTIQHTYAIGRYPITNGQYRKFVDAEGYANDKYWAAAIAAGRWQPGQVRRYMFVQGQWQEGWADAPNDFGVPYNLDNHPVVGVSWYEAVAYCLWLSEQLGADVTLPTEAEWERAARSPSPPAGGAGWGRYPWGHDPDPDRANYADTGIGSTSAVGCFADGAQPNTGCEDLSGNVWEWTRTKWMSDYEDYIDNEDSDVDGSGERRVVRGGSYFHDHLLVRCAYRDHIDPRLDFGSLGFRVVVRFHSSLPLSSAPLASEF